MITASKVEKVFIGWHCIFGDYKQFRLNTYYLPLNLPMYYSFFLHLLNYFFNINENNFRFDQGAFR